MVKSKKISRNRSVTIPKDIAAAVGITAGTAVDLIDSDDMIMIRRHIPICFFCGKDVVNDSYHLCGKTVCANCAVELRKEYDEHYGTDSIKND